MVQRDDLGVDLDNGDSFLAGNRTFAWRPGWHFCEAERKHPEATGIFGGDLYQTTGLGTRSVPRDGIIGKDCQSLWDPYADVTFVSQQRQFPEVASYFAAAV